MRSLLRKLSSLKLKHFILLLLISISVIININFVGTIQKTKVLLSSLALHLVCPQPSSTQVESPCLKSNSSPSIGCILPLQNGISSPAEGVSWGDMVCCSFLEENMSRTNCLIEREMYSMFDEFIEPGDRVLEIGGRYGTVTCSLAAALGNSGDLVSVEADPDVWGVLQYNLGTHSCRSHLVLGVMGEHDHVVLSSSSWYGKRTDPDLRTDGVRVTHFSWNIIEENTGIVFDTLVIDCEGCLYNIINTYKDKFSQIKKIFIENDEEERGAWSFLFSSTCGENCTAVLHFLELNGFIQQRKINGINFHFVFVKDA